MCCDLFISIIFHQCQDQKEVDTTLVLVACADSGQSLLVFNMPLLFYWFLTL